MTIVFFVCLSSRGDGRQGLKANLFDTPDGTAEAGALIPAGAEAGSSLGIGIFPAARK